MAKVKRHVGSTRVMILIFTFAICHSPFAITAWATPTQDEVFKSIQNNLGPTIDGSKVFAVFLTAVGVAMILVVLSKRQKRAALPQKLNHQGKLMRELIKTAGLTRSEAKTLGTLVERLETAGQPLRSPLTLMLCPSLTRQPPEAAAED
jgi:hypothetical protein